VLFLAALVTLLSGCGKSGHSPAAAVELPAVSVTVQKAERKKLASTEEVVGTIRAKLRATLEAKISGRIDALPVLLGQKVKVGNLVARLDAAEIKARLDQARAALQQAERDFKRASTLLEQQAMTRSEFERADSRYLVAKGAVAEAEAMMAYVEVVAPFDGVVTRKFVDVGDLAVPGKPLVSVEDPNALQMEADVPEAIAGRVQEGAQLQVRVDTLQQPIIATVTEKAPVADPDSRTFRAKLDLPPGQPVMPGQFARLRVPVGEAETLRVPNGALVKRGQLEIVFVVEDQRAKLHLVKSGKHLGDEVEILSGLDTGDTVVVEGAPLLKDGQPVTLR